jgi:general secretion pathway protein F
MVANDTQTFAAVILDARGSLVARHIEARSEDEARALAGADGHAVIQCRAASGTPREQSRRARWFPKKTSIDAVAFTQDLATLMGAGVTVKDGVHALARKEASAAGSRVMGQLNEAMAQGMSFSTALERSRAFPSLLVATVAASEQTGDLATGLARYAAHQQSLRTVRDRVIGASVYPLLLLVVGSVIVLMLLGVVVPRFARLLDATGRELPLMSRLLMGWGHYADAHPGVALFLLALLPAAAACLVFRMRDVDVRRRWMARVPGVAPLARQFQHLQMYRTAAILTARGITIHKALLVTTDLLSPADRDRVHAAVRQMREGVTVSAALSGCGLSDVVAFSMLAVAERSGNMAEMLDRIADFHERSLQRHMDILTRLIEPALMIVFGVIIGGIVLLMYLPIFDLASSFS